MEVKHSASEPTSKGVDQFFNGDVSSPKAFARK
jgi:hypothetical protein